MSVCQGEPLEGFEHDGNVREYVRVCLVGHERHGQLCEGCAGPEIVNRLRGILCSECDRPALLIPSAEFERFEAARARGEV